MDLQPISINKSQIITVFELAKAMEEQQYFDFIKEHNATQIPLKIQPKYKKENKHYYWLQIQPRDWHGRFAHTEGRKPKVEPRFTKVKVGSRVILKDALGSKTGRQAEVVKVLGTGQIRTYQIKLGENEYQVVSKPQLMKLDYTTASKTPETSQGAKDSPMHVVEGSNAQGMPQTKDIKLVEDNMPSIINEAKKIYGSYINIGINLNEHGITMEDLMGEAKLAALQHTPKWDAKRGEYWTYIQAWIKYKCNHYINEKSSSWGMIKIPRQKREQLARIKDYEKEIMEQEGRQATHAEVTVWAKATLGLSKEQVDELLAIPKEIYSIYQIQPGSEQEGDEQELIYRIIDNKSDMENAMERKIAYEKIVKFIDKTLPEEEATAIKIRFGINIDPENKENPIHIGEERSEQDVSEIMTSMKMDVTQQDVSRLLESAISKLSKSKEFAKLLIRRHKADQPKHFVVA